MEQREKGGRKTTKQTLVSSGLQMKGAEQRSQNRASHKGRGERVSKAINSAPWIFSRSSTLSDKPSCSLTKL